MPPPSCTGISSPITLTILADGELVLRYAGDGAVEIHDVQALRAQLEPVLRHRSRILREHRGRMHFALLQANAMTVLDVDRGNDLHGGGKRRGEGKTGEWAGKQRVS
jgi:hypothetical protein